MARKYTRKQLKKPDEFITLSHKVWVWVREHATRVAAMVTTAVVLIAIVWTWSYLHRSAAEKATGQVMAGLETYGRGIVAADDKLQPSAGKEEDRPFASRQAKLEAIVKQFSEITAEHGSDSAIGRLALVVRAGAYLDVGQPDKATADYDLFLSGASKDDPLFVQAVEGLAYANEAQKKWDAALAALKRLPRDGERQFQAMYHEARILAAKGDKKGAIELYKRIAKDAESRFLSKNANQWLATLAQDA